MPRSIPLAVGFIVLLAAASPQAVEPNDVDLARAAHAFSQQVMSPFCPGRTLTDCPSPDATALRAEIRRQFELGVSEESVRRALEARYGDTVVGLPRSALAWLLPILALAAGAVLLGFTALRLSRPRSAAPAAPAAPAHEVEAQLAAELDEEIGSRGL